MAPTRRDAEKYKEDKLTPDQSADLVLQYLKKQNRPYSATDISANLKNRVTKAAAAKLLKDMHERKEVEGRAAGKQIVYHTFQDEADEASTETLRDIADQTSKLREETSSLKVEEKSLRVTLRQDIALVPLPELKFAIDGLRQERIELVERFDKLQSGNLKPAGVDESLLVSATHKKWARTASARAKIRDELWTQLVDVVGKNRETDLKDELGLGF
ncbi:TBPIP-like protein [Polychaeton citri CBS 116435]|uniref:TBPIP-like protein n=1 Tax=Polychaeton citri CBS 116435 TaxID=1314669 RepID=A0A9P4UR31_9PEZI|nr:TBPIP-like protein [Polychaeton citri CBS 116435]